MEGRWQFAPSPLTPLPRRGEGNGVAPPQAVLEISPLSPCGRGAGGEGVALRWICYSLFVSFAYFVVHAERTALRASKRAVGRPAGGAFRRAIAARAGIAPAAAELDGGRLARAMQSLATDLDAGKRSIKRSPPSMADFLRRSPDWSRQARGTGRLGEVLEQFVDFRQFIVDMRHSVWTALAYPLFLVIAAFGLFLLFAVYVGPMLADIYRDTAFPAISGTWT